MGELPDFQRGQIVVALLAAASVNKLPLDQLYPEQQFARL
jgi:hypothetical protein